MIKKKSESNLLKLLKEQKMDVLLNWTTRTHSLQLPACSDTLKIFIKL